MGERRRSGPRVVALGLGVLVLAACSAAPSPVPAPPPSAPTYQPPATSGDVCLDQLAQRGIVYQLAPLFATAGGCNLIDGVRVARLLAPFSHPATLSCPMALRLDEFEINVVQMAAQRYFDRRVARVLQIGSYSCRDIARTHRLSEHAHGLAIDIAGFELDDGQVISVKHDWWGRGKPAQFLHEVAHDACSLFSVVLTPATNADHANHLHLDIGPRPFCGA